MFTVWPFALRVMDWTTRAQRTIVDYNAWHIAPDRAGRRILCDTNHPDEGLQIIDAVSGARTPPVRQRVEQSGHAVAQSRYAVAEDFAAARHNLSWMENAVDRSTGRSTRTRIPVGAETNPWWHSPATARA